MPAAENIDKILMPVNMLCIRAARQTGEVYPLVDNNFNIIPIFLCQPVIIPYFLFDEYVVKTRRDKKKP